MEEEKTAVEEKEETGEQEEKAEEKEETSEEKELPEIEGAEPEEVAMAKEHGLLEEEGKEEVKEEGKEEEEKGGDWAKEEENKDIIGTDDEELASSEIDPEKVKKYTKNETTLYVRQKKAVRAKETLESENQLLKVQLEAAKRKSERKDDIDDLDKKLDDDLDDDGDKVLTVGELEKREKDKADKEKADQKEAQAMGERLDSLHEEAKAKYDKDYGEGHFSYVLDLAKEVIKNDRHDVYGRKLFAEAGDPKGNAAEFAYKLGKLHPDFSTKKKAKVEGKDNLNRMVTNANKKKPSASLGGGTEKANISESDLTVEDCDGMTNAEWGKLKPETRDRLLKESC